MLEDIKNLGLGEGFFEANSIGGLDNEETEKGLVEQRGEGLGEEHRARGFLGEQRASGLGEKDKGACFGEDKEVNCFGEVKVKCFDESEKETELGEDLEGTGQVSLWDCAKGLTASPVACMTLMCCWLSSSEFLGLWRNSAVD